MTSARIQPRATVPFAGDRVFLKDSTTGFFDVGEIPGVTSWEGTDVPYMMSNALMQAQLSGLTTGTTYDLVFVPMLVAVSGISTGLRGPALTFLFTTGGQQTAVTVPYLSPVSSNQLRAPSYRAGILWYTEAEGGLPSDMRLSVQGTLLVSDPFVSDPRPRFEKLLPALHTTLR